MLLEFGGIVSEGRGSIGGVTFSRNRGGAYARNRTKPVDPSSAGQNTFRTRMSGSVTTWRGLTEVQRVAFNDQAKIVDFVNRLGKSFHPTGMNLYTRGYHLLEMAGLAQVTEPPVQPTIDDKGSGMEYQAGIGMVATTTTANWPANAVMLFWYAINLPNSVTFYKGPYQALAVLLNGSYVADELTVRLDAVINADSSMHAKWRLVGDDGSASAPRFARAFKA